MKKQHLHFDSLLRSTVAPALLAAVALFGLTPAQAATFSWSGGNGTNWTTPSNWGGTVPTSTDNGTLSSTTNRTINVDGPQTLNWLSTSNNVGNYTIGNGALTLTSNGTTSSTAALRVGTGTSMTFNNAVSFTGSLSATIDAQWLTGTAQSLTFNSTVTSSGHLDTVSRTMVVGSTVNFVGNVSLNSGSGNFTWKTGNVDLTLSGTNSWNILTVNSFATVRLNSAGALPAARELLDANTLTTGNTTIQAVGSARSYDANMGFNVSAAGGKTIFSGSNTLTLTGTTTLYRTSVLDVDAVRVNLTGNWTQTGSSGLTKEGSGTLVMGSGGTTTVGYLLGTTINAGTLLVNGNMGNVSGTSDIVTVNASGTLGGTGSIARATTVNANGYLSAGDSTVNNGVGTLSFASGGNLTLATGATLKFDLNGTSSANDLIVTNGGLNLGTGNTFTFDFSNLGIGTYASNTWATIWTNSAAWGTNYSGNTFAIGALSGGLTGGEFQLSGNDLQVRFTAVPEPSTWALLALSLTTVMVLRRRSHRAQ